MKFAFLKNMTIQILELLLYFWNNRIQPTQASKYKPRTKKTPLFSSLNAINFS